MEFAKFMSSLEGRALRVAAGGALIAVGLGVIGGTWGALLAAIGAVSFLTGRLDVNLLAWIFYGAPQSGSDVGGTLER